MARWRTACFTYRRGGPCCSIRGRFVALTSKIKPCPCCRKGQVHHFVALLFDSPRRDARARCRRRRCRAATRVGRASAAHAVRVPAAAGYERGRGAAAAHELLLLGRWSAWLRRKCRCSKDLPTQTESQRPDGGLIRNLGARALLLMRGQASALEPLRTSRRGHKLGLYHALCVTVGGGAD